MHINLYFVTNVTTKPLYITIVYRPCYHWIDCINYADLKLLSLEHYFTHIIFQIVRFEIYHLDLGSQTEDPCDKSNDVLFFSEVINQKKSQHCAKNHLTEFLTRTNEINVTFTTNAEHDAQGFRIFYSAGRPRSYSFRRNDGPILTL